MARYLVTSALPYANGPIHFGHVAGAYLPADVFVRQRRLQGDEVLYICGTDEHGAPIQINAEREGKDPKEYADHWHRVIRQSFCRFGIDFDHFSRTSIPLHHERTQAFFRNLLERGFIFDKVEDQLFCERCQRGLPDRYVTGTCPRCGHDEARGDECPKCAASYDALDLKAPSCKTCGKDADKKPSRHWYLDLPKLVEGELGRWLEEKLPHWRPNVAGEVRKFVREIRPRCITRDLAWGVPVPLKEAEGKVFYVWFDAPIGYISSTIEWAEQKGLPTDTWRTWWQGEDTRLVHFIGKDNIAFHAVIFPGMLLGQGEPYALPDVPANEFLNLEGRKFNTSSGWFISIDDFIDRFEPDTVRWTLTRGAPESRDAEFTFADFQTRVNTELLGTFGNFVSRVLKFVRARFGGVIPEAIAPLGNAEKRALQALQDGADAIQKALDGYSTRRAAEALLQIGYAANKLFEQTRPFKTIKQEPDRAATAVNVACRLVEGLGIALFPFVPETARRIFRQLGLGPGPETRGWDELAQIPDPKGRAIGELFHLFKKIEPETIDKERARLGGAEEALVTEETPAATTAAAPPQPPKKEIDYETFCSLDLRIARVKSAEPVPKTDRLLKLELELEDGRTRTVLSGIRQWYQPEDVVGLQVVYLQNLAPRKMRGIVSEGMVLAANGPGGEAILLQPAAPAPDGAAVS